MNELINLSRHNFLSFSCAVTADTIVTSASYRSDAAASSTTAVASSAKCARRSSRATRANDALCFTGITSDVTLLPVPQGFYSTRIGIPIIFYELLGLISHHLFVLLAGFCLQDINYCVDGLAKCLSALYGSKFKTLQHSSDSSSSSGSAIPVSQHQHLLQVRKGIG